ncbi:hypothetical protein N656DRAFT_844371 [Canariomyces notabilis]|uniref:Uncharacterized protein n=1 Tax=Canariomyces notabilis TaxID=2074819 RepID=A0AAN6TFI5_9PEZI|nr:hypothetical protein N656DRAFT_844371 [Canariomyces arenarius]
MAAPADRSSNLDVDQELLASIDSSIIGYIRQNSIDLDPSDIDFSLAPIPEGDEGSEAVQAIGPDQGAHIGPGPDSRGHILMPDRIYKYEWNVYDHANAFVEMFIARNLLEVYELRQRWLNDNTITGPKWKRWTALNPKNDYDSLLCRIMERFAPRPLAWGRLKEDDGYDNLLNHIAGLFDSKVFGDQSVFEREHVKAIVERMLESERPLLSRAARKLLERLGLGACVRTRRP